MLDVLLLVNALVYIILVFTISSLVTVKLCVNIKTNDLDYRYLYKHQNIVIIDITFEILK